MPSKRVTRRRGRAPHADDSDDDEIERAAQTDSDSHDSASDTDDSDSDSEPVSRHLTPNTSHSPDADEKPAPFFAATPAAWADMLDAHAVRKVRMAEPEPQQSDDEEDDEEQQPVASSSRHSPAPPASFVRRPQHQQSASQSARQAYQHRLESDPSFVPVVGEFWGHDDRLLDKDLRSLSGWWRGRWQGRARGGFTPRGRGRGAFSGPPAQHPEEPAPDSPLDRTWTHDGFEEMRRREDTRARPPRGAAPPASSSSSLPLRGTPPQRGAPTTGTLRPRGGGPLPSRAHAAGRIWYTMKPEYMWTKQHDAFLYFDPALKPRPGQPPGVRVRLPGQPPAVVRAIPRVFRARVGWSKVASVPDVDYVVRLPPTRRAGKGRATAEEEEVDSAFTVKLPPVNKANPLLHPNATVAPVQQQHPLQPDADGWVQPTPAAVALAAAASPPSVPLSLTHPHPPAPSSHPLQPQMHPHPSAYPTAHAPPAFFPFAPPPGFGHAFPPGPIPAFVPSHTPAPSFAGFSPDGHAHAHGSFSGTPPPPGFAGTPPPPPGFATHTPPPGFGTPPPGFGALPPGVGLDARGMPYELVSGRAVVLQAPVVSVPVGVPMQYPGYAMGGHPGMHMGHGHSMSMSALGAMGGQMGGGQGELFARPARVRVEIRAPGATEPAASASAANGVNGANNGVNGVNGNGAKSPAPTSPRSNPRSPNGNAHGGPLSPLSPLGAASLPLLAGHGHHAHTKSKQLRTTAAAFVPGHTPAPSLAIPISSSHAPQYFGYENGNGGGGYESPGGSAYASDGGASGGYAGGGGGGGGGATYYYPYYGAPQVQVPGPGPGDGAVYYQ
ncbi:hypothetical protein B0H16DRAFT_1757274 [Mycena metata]|uniref:Btz domain-containing protein n=1 Tax=Mycena metata TaxID=1033252 RepID=A0AAD7IE42_9AGAR|nr:hypothetical protein B0H16DRAFT_1757274 [Mycena metata]